MEDDASARRRALIGMINGFMTSQAIHALVQLGIPDQLGKERRSADELAVSTGCKPHPLYRLLRAGAALGLLDEDGSRCFALTPLGEGLVTDSPGSVSGWVELIGTANFWQNWGQLADSVRTGETGWRLRLGVENAWTYRAEHPEEGRIFDRAMVNLTLAEPEAVASAYDFSRFRTIVDVAGGRGALLARILRRNPGASGILFDQPHVVESAESLLREQGVSDRCRVEGGSFFDGVPVGGDAYILKSIIHDWYDPEAGLILQNCRRVIGPEGVLLVVERLLDPPNQGADGKLSDLNMLVMPGGMERTEQEYRELLGSAGFKLLRSVPTRGPYFILESAPV